MPRRRAARGFFCIIAACLCVHAEERRELAIAAAANLTDVFPQIGRDFEARMGIHPVFSFASTAQLAQQIENGAPFDVFAGADAQHAVQLDQKHLLTPGSRATYARGVLALWIAPDSKVDIERITDLAGPHVKVVALAKPELAPYGAAAVETLKSLQLWDTVQPKIVYAENISMARQYAASHNAEACFTAYSLVIKSGGRAIVVDEKLHSPIEQQLGIVAASKRQADAKQFVDFLLHGAGQTTLRQYGYHAP
jgi:molybdate transport system substrate-binding protein